MKKRTNIPTKDLNRGSIMAHAAHISLLQCIRFYLPSNTILSNIGLTMIVNNEFITYLNISCVKRLLDKGKSKNENQMPIVLKENCSPSQRVILSEIAVL